MGGVAACSALALPVARRNLERFYFACTRSHSHTQTCITFDSIHTRTLSLSLTNPTHIHTHPIASQVGDEFSRQLSSRGGRGTPTPSATPSPPTLRLAPHFSLVPALLTSAACRDEAVTDGLVQGLASLMLLTSARSGGGGGSSQREAGACLQPTS